MSVLFLLAVVGFLATAWCDRVGLPAWVSRTRYRRLSWFLLLVLLLVTHKMLLFHQELILQIRLCP